VINKSHAVASSPGMCESETCHHLPQHPLPYTFLLGVWENVKAVQQRKHIKPLLELFMKEIQFIFFRHIKLSVAVGHNHLF
jgi:hypothetical protein